MLTVLKSNTAALDFYTRRMRYDVADISPSRNGSPDASHEILSKCIDPAGWKAVQALVQG
jgi:hypothetical protein